jgi:putative hemolysin
MRSSVHSRLSRLQELQLERMLPVKHAFVTPIHLPLKTFGQKVKIHIERERFIIKTAENNRELAGVLRLRHEVFYRELLEKRLMLGMDMDKFDFRSDHLIIIDKKNDAYIGTYRLISSLFSMKFYSATEFDLGPVLDLDGAKLELGRACVHKDYRTGSTIALLWRGITEYIKETGARYLFGCSSIMTADPLKIAAFYRYFEENGSLVVPALLVAPRKKFKIRDFNRYREGLTPQEVAAASGLVPPLIKSYLNMGARICGEPAYDKKFRCADFLSLFDIDALPGSTQRKYRL